jgi:Obg family GTPase CgtA, C-terminal extension
MAGDRLPGEEREDLLSRPCIVVGNKIDLPGAAEADRDVRAFMKQRGVPYFTVSAMTGEGIEEIIPAIVSLARENERPAGATRLVSAETPVPVRQRRRKEPVSIIKLQDGAGFRVVHEGLEKILQRYDFEHEDAILKFARLVRKFRIEERLEENGAQKGDKVYIGDLEFDFEPDRVME